LKSIRCLLMGFLVIVIFCGCNNASSKEFIEELKPQQSNYKLHLFAVNRVPSNEMNEVQAFMHSNPTILDNITEMNGHDYTDGLKKELKKIGVETFPMYVLLNKDGIVSTSPYLSDMKSLIKQELKIK
jgi:hypothetical protein